MKTARDHHIVITPDGPRGPRQAMKSGIVYLASRSGREIIPVAHGCSRGWRVKGSWTDMMIPKPFSRVYGLVLSDRFRNSGHDRLQAVADLLELIVQTGVLDRSAQLMT